MTLTKFAKIAMEKMGGCYDLDFVKEDVRPFYTRHMLGEDADLMIDEYIKTKEDFSMTGTMFNAIQGMRNAADEVEKLQFADVVLRTGGAYGFKVVGVPVCDDESVVIEYVIKGHDDPHFFFTADEEHTEIKVKFADSEATPIYRDPALV